MLYDVFICHASEDKGKFVRPLADELRKANIEVWYDEFTLSVGDSIRRAIDKGLTKSRFGIVVLSKSFFKKNWTQYELDGLAAREMVGNDKVILPIWYNISASEVMEYSPSLAGRIALLSSSGKKHIVKEIQKIVHPEGSPLIEARDELLRWGITPPVITDKYWLNVVEASNRTPGYGAAIPGESIWDRWSFPLPSKNEWGERLAWTAMQLNWVRNAEAQHISPLTPPDKMLEFIESNAGLLETCITYPELTIEYAPQLTIKGNEGKLLTPLEEAYLQNLNEREQAKKTNPKGGTALTVSGECPACDEDWALRHEDFGRYKPSILSHAYFHGGMFGPSVSPYEDADHLIWLLSEESNWLPENIHEMLLSGLTQNRTWLWNFHFSYLVPFNYWESCGKLSDAIYKAKTVKEFKLVPKAKDDLVHRIDLARETLKLPEPTAELLKRFIDYQIPQLWINANKRPVQKRRKIN